MSETQATDGAIIRAIRETVVSLQGRMHDTELSRRSGVPIRTLTRYLTEDHAIPTATLVRLVASTGESMDEFWRLFEDRLAHRRTDAGITPGTPEPSASR